MRPSVTAYHEAGHCAAMLLFNDPIAMATIDGGTGLVTRPERRRYSVNDEAGRERALEYIVTCLAGIAAERQSGVEPSPASVDTDRKMAWTLACKLCNDDWGEADALVERLGKLARRLVMLSWPIVEAIAAALSRRGKLTGAEIGRLLESRPLPFSPVAQTNQSRIAKAV
jgi:hypothetical protein